MGPLFEIGAHLGMLLCEHLGKMIESQRQDAKRYDRKHYDQYFSGNISFIVSFNGVVIINNGEIKLYSREIEFYQVYQDFVLNLSFIKIPKQLPEFVQLTPDSVEVN